MVWSKEEKRIYRRNYYLNHMDREKELMRIYKENNPDKIIEIREQLKEEGYFKNYNKQYKEEHYDEILEYNRAYKKRKWRDNERQCIYLLINQEQEAIYCGSSGHIAKRLENHLGGWSHLNLKDRFEDLKALHFEYAYVDSVTKEQRLYMEYYLINKFNPILNEYTPYLNKFNSIDELDKCRLEELADNLVFKLWTK